MINFADDRTHNLQHAKRTFFRMDLKAGLYGDVLECSLCMLYFFIFLSNFQTLIFFVTLSSRTVRPRRLKLGTHVDSGQMYRVYRNQAAAAYSSLYFFIFFLSSFQILKFFVTLLSETVRPRRLKLGTHVDSGWMYMYTRIRLLLLIRPFIFSFSNIQTLKSFVTLFSAVGPRRLKLGAHVDSGWMYRVYRNQAAAAYLSHYFFIFLSLQFSNIKMFCHTFLRNYEE